MLGFSNTSHHYHHQFTFTEIRRLYWARTLAALGAGLVFIFIPIYLLTLGYSFSGVIFYFLLTSIFNFALAYPAMKLMTIIGANHSMALSNFLQIAFFLLLITLPSQHWPLWIIALLGAVINETYWPAFHSNFSKAKTKGHSGRQISLATAITSVVAAASPAIGGILASQFGIQYVYLIAIGLFIAASIPLLSAEEVVTEKDFSFSRLDHNIFKRIIAANAGHSTVGSIENFVWPVFIFFIVKSYAGVGLLTSLFVVGSVVTAIYVGRREEIKGPRHYLREGSLGLACVNFLRVFANSAGHVFGINILSGVSQQLAVTPFMTEFYESADRPYRLAYVLIMEWAWFFGWIIFFFTLLICSLFLSDAIVLTIGFGLGIPGSMLMRRMR